MKEYRSELVSTYCSVTHAIDIATNALAQDGWELEFVQPMYRSDYGETLREVLLLFSRDRKEQE